MVPGSSKPQTVENLTATDGLGPLPLESKNLGGSLRWTSTRPVKGELAIKYREPIENSPMTQGGPPLAPRIDGDGFSSVGGMFLSGSTLYYASRSNGALHAVTWAAGAPSTTTDHVVSGAPNDWRSQGMFLVP